MITMKKMNKVFFVCILLALVVIAGCATPQNNDTLSETPSTGRDDNTRPTSIQTPTTHQEKCESNVISIADFKRICNVPAGIELVYSTKGCSLYNVGKSGEYELQEYGFGYLEMSYNTYFVTTDIPHTLEGFIQITKESEANQEYVKVSGSEIPLLSLVNKGNTAIYVFEHPTTSGREDGVISLTIRNKLDKKTYRGSPSCTQEQVIELVKTIYANQK